MGVGARGALYGRDLARVHDEGFGDLARHAAGALLALLRERGIPPGALVVDLGCGSGILAQALTRRGYRVLGIDVSPAMLALARVRAPRARWRRGSAFDARLPRCAAVTAVGEVLCYAAAPARGSSHASRAAASAASAALRADRRALAALFARVREALEPGGLFLFDIATPGRAPRSGSHTAAAQTAAWTVIAASDADPARRILTRRITTFLHEESGYRRADEVHRITLHAPGEVAASLRAAGFRVRRLRAYGERPFPRGVAGFLATPAPAPRPVPASHRSSPRPRLAPRRSSPRPRRSRRRRAT
jgi:SAM-dependent methyltransferase